MNDITALVIIACQNATKDNDGASFLFDDAEDEANEGKTGVTVYDSFLQKNNPGQMPKKEHPFILVRPVGFKDTAEAAEIFIPIQAGIHTYGTVFDGVSDIRRLVKYLRDEFAGNSQFMPYSLEKIIATLGDPEDGYQPHPKYYANLELTFTRTPVLNNF